MLRDPIFILISASGDNILVNKNRNITNTQRRGMTGIPGYQPRAPSLSHKGIVAWKSWSAW